MRAVGGANAFVADHLEKIAVRILKRITIEALKRPSCHVERSETSLNYPSSTYRNQTSKILRFAQNDTGAERFNGSTLQHLYEPMTFGVPEWLWGLLMIPLLIALFVRSEHRGLKRLQQFVSARLLPQLAATVNRRRRIIRFGLLLLGLALAIVSLAQPAGVTPLRM